MVNKEAAIRAIVRSAVKSYASGFAAGHPIDVNNLKGEINMKIHNVFQNSLDPEFNYDTAMVRFLDTSLAKVLNILAQCIASLNYKVDKYVEGPLYKAQEYRINKLLDSYANKENRQMPSLSDYQGITKISGTKETKRYESDYVLLDKETGRHYLIGLDTGDDMDNRKLRSGKEALLEQFCILSNSFGEENVKILFSTTYNRFGEGNVRTQRRVRQFFCDEELCVGRDFWNFICKSNKGYDIVIDEYIKNAHYINEALGEISSAKRPKI